MRSLTHRMQYALGMVAALTAASAAAADVDWSKVESALGRPAAMQPGDVHKFSFPRSDLAVTVDGVPVKPALALGSWVAFKQIGDRTVVMGDLVLLQSEVSGVMERLTQGGIEVTALHNHLLRAQPFPMYMHVMGEGDAETMAKTIHTALMASKTPLAPPAAGSSAAGIDLDTAMLDRVLGRKGSVSGGVYQLSVPRAAPVKVGSLTVPPSMGTAIGVNFEPTGGGKAAITGDFVLTAEEVNPVIKALKRNGIEVTALHNHMLGDEPRLFFMHFWANADAESLARGIRAALDSVDAQK